MTDELHHMKNIRERSHPQRHRNRSDRMVVPADEGDGDDDYQDMNSVAPAGNNAFKPATATAAAGRSMTAARLGIVKAMVGPAILYLPHSFADAGYLFAIVAMSAALLLYLYSSNRLLETWAFYKTEIDTGATADASLIWIQESKESMDDDQVEMVSLTVNDKQHEGDTKLKSSKAMVADVVPSTTSPPTIPTFETDDHGMPVSPNSVSYPQLAKIAYGNVGETAVRTGITLMQLGICLTYFIFVPHNLSKSIETLFAVQVPLWMGLVGMVLVEIPLSCGRDIRRLHPTNALANGLILFGLLSCLWLALFAASNDEATTTSDKDGQNDNAIDSSILEKMSTLSPWNDQWYLFVGTSVLLFEGSITLCLPLQEALQERQAPQFPRVYQQTITTIVLFYCVFGITCWTAFGDTVDTVLTTSLPPGVLATTVQLAYSVAVIFTFPLQIFPALEIIVQAVTPRILKQRQEQQHSCNPADPELSSWQRAMVVSVVIALLAIIAVMEMDNLGRVVSLMGALLGCPLAFVFPPLIHSQIVLGSHSNNGWRKRCNHVVAGIGVLAMVGATLTTLATWKDGGEGRR